jgi:hypothetical protein
VGGRSSPSPTPRKRGAVGCESLILEASAGGECHEGFGCSVQSSQRLSHADTIDMQRAGEDGGALSAG